MRIERNNMFPPDYDEDKADWEITSEGLYIATRGFLMRRGYCCANQCRHCPYINWRHSPTWQPVPAERVLRMHVSPKAVAGAMALLYYHEQQLPLCQLKEQEEGEYQQRMIAHYRLLLERWGAKK